jgi:hypothetical protein
MLSATTKMSLQRVFNIFRLDGCGLGLVLADYAALGVSVENTREDH